MSTITLSLKKSLIYEAVKTDTYITGKVEITTDGSQNAKAYNEQAGDDNFHIRKLDRTLRGAVGAFESLLAEFVDASSGSITDNLGTGDSFTITIVTSSRFNDGLAQPMASLAQEFIINRMIAQWWTAAKPELSQFYLALSNDNIASVRRCLTKTAPGAGSGNYTDITGSVS